MLVYKIIL